MSMKNAQVAIYNDGDTLTVALSRGQLTLASGLISPVKFSHCRGYKKTAYSAGVAAVKRVALAAAPLTAGRSYKVKVEIPKINFEWSGYYTATATAAGSAGALTTAIVAFLQSAPASNTLSGKVSVAVASSTNVDFTSSAVSNGDIFVSIEGINGAVQTAYTAPSGTADHVRSILKEAGIEEGTTGHVVNDGHQYTIWRIEEEVPGRHNGVNGSKTLFDRPTFVILHTAATGAATFVTSIDNNLTGAGTAANYFGVPAL
jgi:hypothetical protein